MRKLIGLILSICTPLAFSGEVYRWVDAYGNHVFSDELPAEDSAVTQVREVHVERVRTVPAFKPPRAPRQPRKTSRESYQTRYTEFVITQPENGTAERDDGGNLTVQTHLEPALDSGHFVVLKMDGQPIASGSQTAFQLVHIDRGTHTMTAELTNRAGHVLISTPPVSFTMLRSSLFSPTRQPEEPSEPDDAEIVELFPLID
jgi:hypothetical protein